jgi:meromycolic acid enoyl-[acyl-carrier-protein] reductase
MGLLDGKKIVVTGVLTDASLAYGVARLAREEGAEIVLTGAGRAMSLTQRTARKLGDGIDVYELDVTVPEHGIAVRDALAVKWGHIDGVVHSIGFATTSSPPSGRTLRLPCTSRRTHSRRWRTRSSRS